MSIRTWCRIALGYLIVMALQIGLWALSAPRSFYDDYPGIGRTWVSVDGPYNEHLIRDVGGLYLAFAAVAIAAAVTLARPLVIATSVAALATGVPHLVYHVANRDDLAGGDAAASIGGLALAVALPLALLWVSWRGELEPPEVTGAG